MDDDIVPRQSVSSCVREEMNLPGRKDGAPFCLAGVEVSVGCPRMVDCLIEPRASPTSLNGIRGSFGALSEGPYLSVTAQLPYTTLLKLLMLPVCAVRVYRSGRHCSRRGGRY